MSYKEKRTIVSIITGLIVLLAYCIYTYGKYQSGAIGGDDLKFWAGTMLMFIGVGVVAITIIQIIFHILLSIAISVKEQVMNGKSDGKEIERRIGAEMVSDEMDRLIELKSMRVGFAIAGIGFVVALVSVVLNYSPAFMINIMFISFSVGSMIEGFAQLYFYRKGV